MWWLTVLVHILLVGVVLRVWRPWSGEPRCKYCDRVAHRHEEWGLYSKWGEHNVCWRHFGHGVPHTRMGYYRSSPLDTSAWQNDPPKGGTEDG